MGCFLKLNKLLPYRRKLLDLDSISWVHISPRSTSLAQTRANNEISRKIILDSGDGGGASFVTNSGGGSGYGCFMRYDCLEYEACVIETSDT